jgi:predicted NBD/HSP70 family sugar kinase
MPRQQSRSTDLSVATLDPRIGGVILSSTSDVLEAVRFDRCRSRAEVAEVTGLSKAVVARRVGELMTIGLLEESGDLGGLRLRGRPTRELRLRASIGHVLVADVGASSVRVAIADLNGGIVAHAERAIDLGRLPADSLDLIADAWDELERNQAGSAGRLWGVGIGLPAPVEFSTGLTIAPPLMPGWNEFPVRDHLQKRFGVPVWVDNEVNLMALGEWREGVAAGEDNALFIKIGTAVGAGLISNGQLHRGALGCAGNVATHEGGASIGDEGDRAAREGRSPYLAGQRRRSKAVSPMDVIDGAARGDAACVEIVDTTARDIGGVLGVVVDFYNPGLLVIGGRVASAAGDPFLAALRQQIYANAQPLSTRDLRIVPSSLNGLAGVIGAAAMVLGQLFRSDRLPETLERSALTPAMRQEGRRN